MSADASHSRQEDRKKNTGNHRSQNSAPSDVQYSIVSSQSATSIAKEFTSDMPEDKYEYLLKEILDETSDDENEQRFRDVVGGNGELSEELRLALENKDLGEQYLQSLKFQRDENGNIDGGHLDGLKTNESSAFGDPRYGSLY